MLSVLGRWIPAAVWMYLIFCGSSDVLSAGHTSRFIEPFLRWLFTGISQTRVDDLHFLIRKTGHICEYAVLALLFWWALRPWSARTLTGKLPQWAGHPTFLAAWLLTVMYAASDEFHQSFVSSRGASVHDVAIDALGAAAALALVCALQGYSQKRVRPRPE